MIINRLLCPALCCLVLSSVSAANLKPGDFAFAMPLTLQGNAPIYRIVVPLDVYAHATQLDLGDVRVFNAAGEIMPYAIRTASPTNADATTRKSIPIFPLYGNPDQAVNAMRITLETADSRVNVQTAAKREVNAKIEAYLFDARSLDAPIDTLELSWQQRAPFAFNVHLESSDDLAQWHTVAQSLAIADLRFAGQTLTEKRLEFPETRAHFFRLSWPASAPTTLDAAIAESRVHQTGEPGHQSFTVVGAAVAASPDTYDFDVGGTIAVDRINLKLPESNNLVRGEVLGRVRGVDPWTHVSDANFYQLDNQGTQIRNAALTISPVQYRYWQVHLLSPGSLGTALPALEVRWQPHELYFIARGAGPFQLAFGKAALSAAPSAVDQLLGATRGAAQIAVGTTQVGSLRELGGVQQLVVTRSVNWKTWLLWAALVTGVLLLALMALKLSREMKRAE